MIIGSTISGAVFSDDHRYRYALWRIWDRLKDALQFTGLNSSTAAEHRDDPTVVRVCNFAKSWGFGGAYFSNLRAIVSAYPKVLLTPDALKDEENDEALRIMRDLTTIHMVGWGEWGRKLKTRPDEVLKILGEPVYCLKVNQSGEPCHPLYLPRDSKLIEYKRRIPWDAQDGNA